MAEHALVTGTSSGIGAAIAEKLLASGWRVTGLDRAAPIVSHPRFVALSVDLTDALALAQALQVVHSCSALVHAAGVLRTASLGFLSREDGALMWSLHVAAAAQLADTLCGPMRAAGHGRMVVIASRVADGAPGKSQYAASKAALIGLARSWASELIKDGITVNVVSPAATATAMLHDPARASTAPRLPPIGRLIRPDEIASTVAFLLSPAAAAITGQNIVVCGGASLV